MDAVAAFEARTGRRPDYDNPVEIAEVVTANRGEDVTFELLKEASQAAIKSSALQDEAACAMQAVTAAWQGDPPRLLDWVGCTERELEHAVQASLTGD